MRWIECPECSGIGSVNRLSTDNPRQAVIEAAKAFIAKSEDGILVPWHDLRRAVEELLAAEKGDSHE